MKKNRLAAAIVAFGLLTGFRGPAPQQCAGCIASGGGPASSSVGGYSVSIIVVIHNGQCVSSDGSCVAAACSADVARGWTVPAGATVSQCETQTYSNGSTQTLCYPTVTSDGQPGASTYPRRAGCGNSSNYFVSSGPASASITMACSACGGI